MKADAQQLLNEFIATSQGVQYVIPVYQRNYTWGKSSVLKLLGDIKKLLDKKSEKHFLGNLVYIETKTEHMTREWSIVDGQQRLTTIFLVLYAIRNYLIEKNQKDDAKMLTVRYLENVGVTDENYKLRLKPLVSNDEEFKKIATSANDDEDSNSLIRKNFNIIRLEIIKWFENYSLLDIIDALNKLYIVYIRLDKTDNAQQIFESINSDGEGLKASDLIRNFVLMNKDDNTQTKLYKNYWKEIEKNINDDTKKLEAFFRFYVSSKNFVLSSKNDLYVDFISYWETSKEKLTDEEILANILRYSIFYTKLFIQTNSIKKEISVLRKIQSDMPTPLLLGLAELQYTEKINEMQFLECVALVNAFIIRRHMCNLDTSAISRIFPAVLKEVLDKCKSNYSQIVDILKYCLENNTRQKSSYLPNDDELKATLSKMNAYVLSHTRTFFEIVEDENKIKVDKSNLTIEHVMPQKSTKYWVEYAGTENEDEYVKLVNLIGNLTFADKSTNSSVSNKDFKEKKKRLEEIGKIDLSKDIFDKEKWGKQEITNRTELLIEKFIEIFPFFTSKTDYDSKNAFTITYNACGVIGAGKLYNKSKLIIDVDSEIRITDKRSVEDDKIISYMLENNELEEIGEKYVLKKEMQFTSPTDAIDFIVGGRNNGWDYFKDEDGNVIKDTVRALLDK